MFVSVIRSAVIAMLACIVCACPSPIRAAEGGVVTKLTAPAEDIAVAGAGQTLVLKLRAQKGLSVYDARTQKLTTIELPTSDFAFGAGGDTAVVFLKESNEIRSYSLKTLALIRAKEFADPIIVMRIVMGHSRGDLAFVRIARGTEQLSHTSNHLLDVTTLTLIRPTSQQSYFGHNTSYRDVAHYRANGDMSRLTEWATSHTPSGIYLYTRTEAGYQLRGNHDSAGHLAIGDDGRIYTGFGGILDFVPSPDRPHDPIGHVARITGQSLFPGIGGLFFLGLPMDGSLSVYQTGETTALCPLDSFPEWTPPRPRENSPRPPQNQKQAPGMLEQWIQGPLTLDKRIVFAPAAGHLIFLPHSNDRLIQRKFDLKEALDKTGKDYLLVLSNPPLRSEAGATWDYQITTLAKHGPVQFELEHCPEGMTLSPAGSMAWKVPGGIEGKAQVVLAITDSKSNTIRHRFTVAFR